MSNWGEKLHAARLAKQLTPQQVELETRIRAIVLSALEEQDLANLPPPPFTRGLLRNYARYLGLDPEEILAEYALSLGNPPQPPAPPSEKKDTDEFADRAPDQLPAPAPSAEAESLEIRTSPYAITASEFDIPLTLPESLLSDTPTDLEAATPETVPEYASRMPSTPRIPVSPEVLAIIIVAFVVLALGYTAYTQLLGGGNATRTPAPTQAANSGASGASSTSAINVLPTITITATLILPTPVPTFAATIPPALLITPTATATLNVVTRTVTATVEGEMILSVEAQQQIFLWVIADNREVFKGNFEAGVAKEFIAKQRMYVQIKNIPNAKVLFNGKALLPATFAERTVLERAWLISPRGTPIAIAPDATLTTPIVTETPTPTPLPTNTPANTNTPRPTSTETPAG